jgi:hypothetical protein
MRSIRREQLRKARREEARKLIPTGLRWPLLLLLLIVSAPLALRLVAHRFFHKHSSLYGAEWKVYSPGQSRLSLLLPAQPRSAGARAPDAGAAVAQADRYQVAVGEFNVSLWDVTYGGGASVDLRQAARGVRAALQEPGEVAEYREEVSPTRRYGQEGLLVSGAFRRGGEERLFRALLLTEGDRLWQVVLAYPATDRAAVKAAQRMIDSVRVDGGKDPATPAPREGKLTTVRPAEGKDKWIAI